MLTDEQLRRLRVHHPDDHELAEVVTAFTVVGEVLHEILRPQPCVQTVQALRAIWGRCAPAAQHWSMRTLRYGAELKRGEGQSDEAHVWDLIADALCEGRPQPLPEA